MRRPAKILEGVDRQLFATSACALSMVLLNVVRLLAVDLGMRHGDGFVASALLLHVGLSISFVWNFVRFLDFVEEASRAMGEDPTRNVALATAGSFACLYGMFWFRNRVARALSCRGF